MNTNKIGIAKLDASELQPLDKSIDEVFGNKGTHQNDASPDLMSGGTEHT